MSTERKKIAPRCKNPFIVKKQVFPVDATKNAYDLLVSTTKWVDGVRSARTGFTRKAHSLRLGDNPLVDNFVIDAFKALEQKEKYLALGIYLNYYQDGEMYTPPHIHKDSFQLIVSLGETRKFEIGTKTINTDDGDVLFFGSQRHGIPKQPTIKKGRISIAVFLVKAPENIPETLKTFLLG